MPQQQTVKQIRYRVGGNKRWTFKTLGEAIKKEARLRQHDRTFRAIELVETTTRRKKQ